MARNVTHSLKLKVKEFEDQTISTKWEKYLEISV